MKRSIVAFAALIAILVGACGAHETGSDKAGEAGTSTKESGITTEDSNNGETAALEIESEEISGDGATKETSDEAVEVTPEIISKEEAESEGVVISIGSIFDSFGNGPENKNLEFWKDQGMEAEMNDGSLQMYNSYKFYFPGDRMYVFADDGMLDEDELAEAGATREELEQWFEKIDVYLFPKQFSYSNAKYISYFQLGDDFVEKGKNLKSLLESNDKRVFHVITTMIEQLGAETCYVREVNGMSYAYCYGQSNRGFGAIYMTVQNGDMLLIYFDSVFSSNNAEFGSYIDCVLNSVYPLPVTTEELKIDNDADFWKSDDAVKFWEYLGREVPEPNRSAVMARVLELQYPDEQLHVFISGNVDIEEAEEAGLSDEELEYHMSYYSADAVAWPKEYSLTGEGYTCYLRVIPEYAEKGETLTSLRDNGDKKLQEIMKKYALTNIYEHNGIEYVTNMVETLESGVVLLDLTVFDGNLIAMAYSFDGDHLSEATAFRNYMLSSIFPIKAND